ncbi:MAG: ATP-binding protein [Desulfobacterales bacterium]|nr:ATP-binding protein [Desulfobacterales bacterium]
MRKLSVKFRVVLGLTGLTVSLVMLAVYLGIVPDRTGIVRESRTALSETIAVHSTAMVMASEFERLRSDFKLLAKRNADLLSLALRRSDGVALIATGDHKDRWQSMEGEYSRDTQVRVPIWSGEHKWGQLELRFKAQNAGGLRGFAANPIVQLTLFMGVLCFAVFYFYIGKVLRHLDPSQAIPGRVRSALDTLAGGLLVLDNKEQIVLANKAFATLLGRTPEDLMGHRAGDLPWIDPQDNKVTKSGRPWVQALESGEVQANRILRLAMKDDERLTFSINCSPVLGSGGKYAGVLVSFDDVTLLEKKEIELRRSKEEAESANQAKSAFLANMSHEIRTPMTAILGFTEILKRGYGKNRQDSLHYLDTIHSSGQNLLELINDILDLSKVESGRLEVEETWIEPHRIIQDVIRMLDLKAREKDLALSFAAKGRLPQKIKTDPARFRQIIFNLVGNAIKFTAEGSVTVVCQLKKKETSQLQVDIRDTGIGIAPDKVASVFDPFTQADAAVTRHFGGTGLGLAISRNFARALGGDITAASVPGQGSTFSVTLATGDLTGVAMLGPEEVITAAKASDDDQPTRWQFPEARVLIVDDGAENRELLRLFIEDAGATADEAENGEVGVAKALADNYDVILMDVNMPVMDGFTATRQLRKQGLETPIIALTANAMKGFERECLEAGYSDYFSKPIDINRFMKLMADLLGGKPLETKTEAGAAADSPAEEPVAADPVVDLRPIVSTLPANNERFRKLAARFITRLHEQLDAAAHSHRKGQTAELAAFAHWLKGAGGSVGFDALTAPASKLEALAKAGGPSEQITQTLGELLAIAARLAGPGTTPHEASPPAGKAAQKTASVHTLPQRAASSDRVPPLMSRLGDNPRLQGVIRKFIAKLNGELKSAKSALDQGDLAQLALIAHWLKGAGGTVGFDEFTAPAAKLEQLAKSDQAADAGRVLEQLKSLAEAIVPPAASQGSTAAESAITKAQVARRS